MRNDELALIRAEWQPVLFAERPARRELLQLRPIWSCEPITLRIHRNHSFEHVAAAAEPWFAFWDRTPRFIYSDYDDALSLNFPETEMANLEVIWVDLARYSGRMSLEELALWLSERCTELRRRSLAPIIIIGLGMTEPIQTALNAGTKAIAGLHIADLQSIAAQLGSRYLDERAARFSGTRFSDAACILLAREIACRWVPSALVPRLKAVAVDLDQTLYNGVLGEEGHAVTLSPGHVELQKFIAGLSQQGVFLALVSKNEEEDVRRLFQERPDFPLRWESFSAVAISWEDKTSALRQIAQKLRIGLDAILFLDDNPGELAAAAAQLPGIVTAHAMTDPAMTLRMLLSFPRLWTWQITSTDLLRSTDLEAAQIRSQLAEEVRDPAKYLASLKVQIRIDLDARDQLQRVYELSQKTNQFNLNLARFSETEIAQFSESPDYGIATMSLRDRLSDSGIIGILIVRRELHILNVIELAISCRALGRGLESLLIAEALRASRGQIGGNSIRLHYRTGPRNGPARDWLAGFAGEPLNEEGQIQAPEKLLEIEASQFPVDLTVTIHGKKNDRRAIAANL